MQNTDWVTVNLAEMTSFMVNHTTRTKVTTNHQFQTECHQLTIQIDVQSMVILPIMMALHVLLRNTNARHATNLDTLPFNVSKDDNTHNTKLDNPKLIKYMWITYMMTQIVIHQILVLVKISSVFKWEYGNNIMRNNKFPSSTIWLQTLLLVKTTSYQEPISQGKNRHWCWDKPHAC